MDYSLYFSIRQILMCLLIFMGCHMLFVKLEEQLHNSFFQRSLRLMGLAFLLVPISCFLYTRSNRLDLDTHFASAISLAAYFPTFILMTIAFLTLLGRRFSRVVMGIISLAVVLYPLPLWLSLASKNEELISIVMTVSYSLFIIIVVLLVIAILVRYHQVSRNIDNYYSDDILICVKWISKSIKLLIGLAVTCAIAPLFFCCTHWVRLSFMLYGVLCYIHIHYGYRRMQINIMEQIVYKNQSISNFATIERGDNDDITHLKPDVARGIESKLLVWISEKRYMQQGVTINMVAKDISTNRTYLSKYINTTYDDSFKSWITKLRIKEAKRLLAEDAAVSISNIATLIGFASVESFTHIFSRIEGRSPSKWRDEHRK